MNSIESGDELASRPVGTEPALAAAVTEALGAELESPLAGFAAAFLHRLPANLEPDAEVLAPRIRSLFEFIVDRPSSIGVRVFNPTVAEHGYSSPGTVLEINVVDSAFLLDSITGEIDAHGLHVLYVIHPVIGTERDTEGRLVAVRHARQTLTRESVQHYQLDRTLFDADLPGLERAVRAVLEDVRRTVDSFHPLLGRVDRMIDLARVAGRHVPEAELEEVVAFLQWLKADNFVFLGYREYQLVETADGTAVSLVPNSGLGILEDDARSAVSQPVLLSSLRPELAARYQSGDLLVVTKTNRLSPVHRRAKMDYIGVRILGPDGKTKGEARMVGLYTTKAYMEPSSRTPVIRRKLAAVMAAEDLIEGSHDHKAMAALFEGFSKHDLFSASVEDLRRAMVGMLALQERDQVRLFIRRDLLERSVSILVAMPRDRFNATLRRNLQDLFVLRFGGTSVDYHLDLGEADPAQIHFTVWMEGAVPEVDRAELEAEVVDLARSWQGRLIGHLTSMIGESEARQIASKWGPRLPEYYTTSNLIETAASDVLRLNALERADSDFLVGIQDEPDGEESLTRIALYRKGGKLPLSQLVTALENLGLEVVEEVPTRLKGGLFIHDFGVRIPGRGHLDLDECGERVNAALEAAWSGESETDDLNRLIVTGGLLHEQVAILRAYRTYWRRVMPVFTIAYVNDILVSHPMISGKLVRLFELKFNPDGDGNGFDDLGREVREDLDAIPSLDADRVLRAFLRLIEATLRTNFYQDSRACLAFKLRSPEVPDIPRPHPMFEVFVLAPGVEGIHLRGGMVARGGIRWSTRREDYRTEVLGLMKAQMTKNAVIVPTGAKGGFVLRHAPEDPAELRAEVEAQYRVFIGGLLDVTDNLVAGEVVRPSRVRAHDPDDTYLVVAADKGTATFSDVANSIALQRGFWLGDAFASGGSSGYDHKALGITARGAWRSLERHFQEMGINPNNQPFTALGIGDMSGDVFGNGMLGSDQIKLVAAFDHRHVFVDPDPDSAASYAERKRLFDLPRSSWADYDTGLISAGGGVFGRELKKISLTDEMREVLGTDAEEVPPNDLIRIILRAPADMLWNGGIGTYVKAEGETHDEVGDRTNDAVRVNGMDLRCKVVIEGGNLGLTQNGRIEYAGGGGRINTDFIDNSGGVDCSDREVNLKILLGMAIERGELDLAGRDELIASVAGDVVERILYDNFQQAQMLSQEQTASGRRCEAYEELMVMLEEEGILDRAVECLPTSEVMAERSRLGEGLTRPELAVLLADSKRWLAEALNESALADDPYVQVELSDYFPAPVVDRFGHLLAEHPLRKRLISTLIANDVVNSEGVVFVTRLMAQTGANPVEVVAAYRIARDVTGAVEKWQEIEQSLGVIEAPTWTRMMQNVDRMVAAVTRWYLGQPKVKTLTDLVAESRPAFARIEAAALESGPPEWRASRQERIDLLTKAGATESLAKRQASLPVLNSGADIIEVARRFGLPEGEVLDVFLHAGRALGLDRLTEATRQIVITNRWQRGALWTLEEDLLAIRRRAAERVLETAGDLTGQAATERFLAERVRSVARLVRLLRSMEGVQGADLAPVMVALRQVRTVIA